MTSFTSARFLDDPEGISLLAPVLDSSSSALSEMLLCLYGIAQRRQKLGECCQHLAQFLGADRVLLVRVAAAGACAGLVATAGGGAAGADPGPEEGLVGRLLDASRALVAAIAGREAAADVCTTSAAELGAVVSSNAECSYVLWVHRNSSRSGFDAAAQGCFRFLLPHIRQALMLRDQLDQARSRVMISRQLLDRAPSGFIALLTDGRVVYWNEEALLLLQEADGLSIDQHRLSFWDPRVQSAVDETLGAMRAADKANTLKGSNMQLPRPSGLPCYELAVLPVVIAPEDSFLLRRRMIFLAITDPAPRRAPGLDYLHTLYGLTPAEARVCQYFCQGLELDAVATKLSTSVTTAKTHLMHIYQKLGINSRSGLVSRLQGHYWTSTPIVVEGGDWESLFSSPGTHPIG